MEVIVKRHPPDELYHFGVQGQKWGLRRYQNEDGSLTPAGREHYGYSMSREVNRLKTLAGKQNKYSLKSKRKKMQATKSYANAKKPKLLFGGVRRRWSASKYIKREVKADKLAYKAEKKSNQGTKLYEKIKEKYKNMPADTFQKSDLTYLKKYSSRVLTT